MTKVTMRWNSARVVRELRRKYQRRVVEAAEHLQAKIVENISQPGPPASSPGEYPHRESGELAESVVVLSDGRDLTLKVTCDAPHAKHVERIRPFLKRTAKEEKATLRAIILGKEGGKGHYR